MSALEAELIQDVERLKELSGEWDRLAVAAARPFAAPGWLLPWWRSARSP
jgi:hypothetical protein